eukprot:320552-Chlamydomonas_euryale.AAC.17
MIWTKAGLPAKEQGFKAYPTTDTCQACRPLNHVGHASRTRGNHDGRNKSADWPSDHLLGSDAPQGLKHSQPRNERA